MNKITTNNTSQNKETGKEQKEIENHIKQAIKTLVKHPVFSDKFNNNIESLNYNSSHIERSSIQVKLDSATIIISDVLYCLPLVKNKNSNKSINTAKKAFNELLHGVIEIKKRALINCLIKDDSHA